MGTVDASWICDDGGRVAWMRVCPPAWSRWLLITGGGRALWTAMDCGLGLGFTAPAPSMSKSWDAQMTLDGDGSSVDREMRSVGCTVGVADDVEESGGGNDDEIARLDSARLRAVLCALLMGSFDCHTFGASPIDGRSPN